MNSSIVDTFGEMIQAGKYNNIDFEMMEDLKQYKYIAMDTETNGLRVWKDDFKLVGISLAGSVDKGYYIPLGHINKGSKRQYKQLNWEDLKASLNKIALECDR